MINNKTHFLFCQDEGSTSSSLLFFPKKKNIANNRWIMKTRNIIISQQEAHLNASASF